jgi:hypothetical protein
LAKPDSEKNTVWDNADFVACHIRISQNLRYPVQ